MENKPKTPIQAAIEDLALFATNSHLLPEFDPKTGQIPVEKQVTKALKYIAQLETRLQEVADTILKPL